MRASPTRFFKGPLQGAHTILIGFAPLAEVGMYRSPLGKVAWQHAPLATTFKQVEHGAPDLKQIHHSWLGFLAYAFQQWPDLFELFTTHVAWIMVFRIGQ